MPDPVPVQTLTSFHKGAILQHRTALGRRYAKCLWRQLFFPSIILLPHFLKLNMLMCSHKGSHWNSYTDIIWIPHLNDFNSVFLQVFGTITKLSIWLSLITVVPSLSLSVSLSLKTGTICVWGSISACASVTLIRVLDRYTWHIQSFLSLFPAHRRFIWKKHSYICSATFALTSQLMSVNYLSPESNTFSCCQVISMCSSTLVGRIKIVQKPPPVPPPLNLASHWKISRSIHLLMFS